MNQFLHSQDTDHGEGDGDGVLPYSAPGVGVHHSGAVPHLPQGQGTDHHGHHGGSREVDGGEVLPNSAAVVHYGAAVPHQHGHLPQGQGTDHYRHHGEGDGGGVPPNSAGVLLERIN